MSEHKCRHPVLAYREEIQELVDRVKEIVYTALDRDGIEIARCSIDDCSCDECDEFLKGIKKQIDEIDKYSQERCDMLLAKQSKQVSNV